MDMFHYELDITDIRRHDFSNPVKLKLAFDFIDVLLQLLDKPIDEIFKDLNIHVDMGATDQHVSQFGLAPQRRRQAENLV